MKINRNRLAEVEIEYSRSADETGAFLESVYAVDASGQLLGGGRWSKANRIFSNSGKFKTEFVIPPNSTIKSIKCIFVTKFNLKPLEFTIDKVFQM